MTLDEWSDLSDLVLETAARFQFGYFVLLVIIGEVMISQLITSIMCIRYEEVNSAAVLSAKQEKQAQATLKFQVATQMRVIFQINYL